VLGPDRHGLHRPASEDEIRELVRWARLTGRQVRVRGTGHSVDEAIYTSARLHGRPGDAIDMVLDRYTGIEFDDERMQVTVQAGCRLGADPRDASGRATVRAGLCWQLEQRGWALPVTAGVTRQTVAGFLMTGSAGGSRAHALDRQVAALRLIDAEGEVHDVRPGGDLFHAAGVSLGLLGIVSTVTFQCVERFDVEGTEQVVRVGNAPFDAFADDGVEGFLAGNEYARFFWWPQRGVDRLTIWEARRAGGAPTETRPYRILPEVLGSTLPAQVAAGKLIATACRRKAFGRVGAAVYNAFLAEAEPQRFRDAWWRVIPMDDDLDERFFPTTYTEMWFPAEASGEVMRRLRDHFAEGGFAATGAYAFEVYAGAASDFWMSPGYGRDSTRLNVCWMETNPGDPRERFFPQFWELFADLGFRLHWAKNLFANRSLTAARLRPAYPRWDDFLELRGTLDPDGVFLSDYWREHLGIPQPSRAPVMSDGRPSSTPSHPPRGRLRWPLLVKLRPSDAGFAERADYVIDEHAVIAAPPEAIYDAIVDLQGARDWLADFVRAEWVEGPDEQGRQVVDELFTFMTQRVRTFHAERGRRWMASIDACTLPLGREMMEDVELSPLPDGRTQLRWRYYYETYRAVAPIRKPLHDYFAKMIRKDIEHLGEWLEARHAPATDAAAPKRQVEVRS
jgi:FAD/FMN-containing dehydrogenase